MVLMPKNCVNINYAADVRRFLDLTFWNKRL
uniref:Uncharacterized protein n=1 Tax=Myoviridae sp. ctAca11 TaxID=2825043 RepID=A0A8S5Q834_9CAUD|nr:MAG TPA: hypothetical protein [Myoviridae sp. ctAca11]